MKLRNKLILSCAALAAVATTAFSTTFAWYTSNTKVQANNVEGQTAAAGNDMLLVANGLKATTTGEGTSAVTTISAISDATQLVFTSEIDVVAEYVGTGLTNGKLMPSAYKGGFLQNQESALAAASADATTEAAASYLHFVLYLKNQGTNAGTVTMKIDSLANASTLANLTPFPVLGTADQNLGQFIFGGTHTYHEGETYKIDVCRALAMDYTIQKTESASSLSLAGEASEAALDISTGATSILADSFANVTGGALSYYNGVVDDSDKFTGSAPSALGTYSATDGVKNIAIDASEASLTKIDFKIFLNGWADACFDACQGQTFNFNLKFEFVKSQNNG